MKQRGTAQGRYAKLLLEQGVSYDEILKDSAMQGFNPATLRTIAKRVREEKERNETRKKDGETPNETQRNAMEAKGAETAENASPDAKNPVLHRLQVVSFGREFAQTFHPADAIFYSCVGIGCLGVSNALPGVGVAVAAVWFFTAAMLLHRLKMYRRWYDVFFGIVVEILAGGTAHYSWANAALWRNIKELPFEVYVEKYRNGAGELVAFYAGKDVEMPGKIALCIAACLVVFAGYAAFVSVLANKEKG